MDVDVDDDDDGDDDDDEEEEDDDDDGRMYEEGKEKGDDGCLLDRI